jgi:hypothetical protein
MQTRKYPRTLQQAFGPYTSSKIEEPGRFVWSRVRIALAVAYLASFVTLICVLPGGPK